MSDRFARQSAPGLEMPRVRPGGPVAPGPVRTRGLPAPVSAAPSPTRGQFIERDAFAGYGKGAEAKVLQCPTSGGFTRGREQEAGPRATAAHCRIGRSHKVGIVRAALARALAGRGAGARQIAHEVSWQP